MFIRENIMDKELTPKQQTSESIRQAESILVITGQNPTVDQVASTLALSAILKKFGKKVSTVISDDIPASAKFLDTSQVEKQLGGLRDFIMHIDLSRAEVDKLKYTIENGKLNVHVTPFSGSFKQQDVSYSYGDYHYDLIIVLGVASYSRIDRVYAQNEQLLEDIPMVNIDFHRINEQYGAINLIEPNAAGLGELLVALSESLQTGLIDTQIATTILTGIMASTDRFTATHTTSKAMTVAAQMMAMGADQKKVVQGLYGGRNNKGKQDRPQGPQSQSQQQSRQDRPQRQNEQPKSKPKMQAEIYEKAGLEPGGTIAERAVFINAEPDIHAPLEGVEVEQPTMVIEHVQEPLQKTVEQPQPQPQAVEAPRVEPVQAQPQPQPHEFETDGPAVTDPDDQPQVTPVNIDDEAPEPLINDQPSSKAEKPQAAPSDSKRSNPTNNPIFANRLS